MSEDAPNQMVLGSFGAFEQPPVDERDTYTRTIIFQVPVLTAKKAGMLNRGMKEYRRAREAACDYFREHDPFELTLTDQNELSKQIRDRPGIHLSARQVAYGIRAVEQNYKEYAKDQRASPPEANFADTIAISRKGTRLFQEGGRYYLNVRTGHGDVNLPLRTSDAEYHTRRLPAPGILPATTSKRQRRAGVKFTELEPEDYPGKTVKLSTSTIQKQGPRRFTANLSFQIAKDRERDYDPSDARYVVGVDRGRNALAYAALYDSDDDHVIDWFSRSGDEVEHYMDRFMERITEFQEANVWGQMDDARERRFRYKEQIDYEIANAVVDLAQQMDGSVVIAMEDLEDMSRLGSYSVESRRFNEWSYYRLGQYIEQKATPADIPVRRVDAVFTSQWCSRCGETEATDRHGVYFECESCGYEQHADANAAVNVAKRFAGEEGET